MADITTSSLDQLLKRLYANWEIEQLVNLEFPVLNSCFAKGSAQLGGEGFYFPVRVESAEGHAYISETSDLPAAQQSTVRQAQIAPKVHAGVVRLTGLSMAVSSQSPMAFAEAFDENVQQTIEAMSAYKEGAAFRAGDGVLATFSGNPGATAGPHTLDDVGFLREGMYVDINDVGTPTTWLHTNLKVTAVDWVNKTVTFASALAAGVDDTDAIYIADSQDTSTSPVATLEPVGLEGSVLDSGTYLNIDRATYSNWKAGAYDVSGFFDESAILRSRTRLTQESGIGLAGISSRMKFLTHPIQGTVLFKLAMPRIRYSGNEAFDLGNSEEVKFGNIPIMTSYLAPADKAYLGDWRYSQSLYTAGGELHIDTQYNGSALKWVADKDIGLVFMKEYHNFVLKRPNAFVRLYNLSGSTDR